MGRVRPHRRNSNGNQLKALPMEAMYSAGISIISLIIYAATIVGSVFFKGDSPRWLGGIGTLGFIMGLVTFIYNLRQMKTKTELKYRLICLAISGVIFLIWLATLIVGIIN
ncbi:MAG: hypothetical protein K6E79_01385 [Pseudobutyrivibrio sp.]|nr:hypothetical protein [Pseudobutyrivibrio sp.]